MNISRAGFWPLALTVALLAGCQQAAMPEGDVTARVQAVLSGDHRSAEHRARDSARRPAQTLAFWGLQPDMTVVEVWPGSGWYTEVLAPLLRDHGKLIAASFPETAKPAWRADIGRDYLAMLQARPDVYGRVEVVPFDPPEYTMFTTPGSADMVILSRHFHNFISNGIVDEVLSASRQALRPGGVLAIVQHRAQADATPEWEQRTGYVREQWLINTVESAGFVFDASSPLNHNPDDSREHEDGVWSLPPSLRTCTRLDDTAARQACEAKYMAIGESDRMTLRFIRP